MGFQFSAILHTWIRNVHQQILDFFISWIWRRSNDFFHSVYMSGETGLGVDGSRLEWSSVMSRGFNSNLNLFSHARRLFTNPHQILMDQARVYIYKHSEILFRSFHVQICLGKALKASTCRQNWAFVPRNTFELMQVVGGKALMWSHDMWRHHQQTRTSTCKSWRGKNSYFTLRC